MEFKFEFPLGGGSGDGGNPGGRRPEPGSGDGGNPGDRQGPAPAAAQRRRLREHVVGDPADLRPLLERTAAAVSVLEAGGLRIKHIEPSALLWPGAEGEEEEGPGAEGEEEEGPGAEGEEEEGPGAEGEEEEGPGAEGEEGPGEGEPGAAGREEGPGAAGSGPGAEEGGPGEEGPGAEEGGPGEEGPGAEGEEEEGPGAEGEEGGGPGEEEEEGPGAEEGGPGEEGPGAEEGGPGEEGPGAEEEEGPGAEEGGHVGERAAPGPGKERPGAGQGRLPWDLLSLSDLVPGLYEGGLKVWECTADLVDYLAGVELRGLRVLDLGCGAGLLGIAALGKGAACVHFQDYNGEVLEWLTIPNVALLGRSLPGPEVGGDDEPPAKRSRAEGSLLARCRFFSGPWSLFAQVHGDRDASFKYDVILSSETLYNPHSYAALHHALTSLLSDQGTIYLATKAHYFGVGGGIHLFQNFVKEKQIFDLRTVKVIDDGLQRCIALMSFRRGRSP
ncbi:histidine protein methyltransferase 1 homolog [Pristis pectinata]|uniref:histidine protein methyltransferase 1 homolog n=1 Tax=Pristis pectinata TaxID=685728 RepID=UPI00223D5F69|nr:histidine protein methyltransferase 1 homolog [Pristis pectinata]